LSLAESLVQTNLSPDYKKDNVLIKKAKEMLHDNLMNVPKLDEICGELHLSKFQFIYWQKMLPLILSCIQFP